MTRRLAQIVVMLFLPALLIAQGVTSEVASTATFKLEVVQRKLKLLGADVEAALVDAQAAKKVADKDAEAKGGDKDGAVGERTKLQVAMGDTELALRELRAQLKVAAEDLSSAHAKASTVAPSRVAVALAEQQDAFRQAGGERDPEVAETAYGKVARKLGGSIFADWSGASSLKAVATFKRAELMVRRGKQMQRSRKRAQGEGLLKKAASEFDRLVNGPDFAGEWGTSLHACALRRSIGIYGAFYERYIASRSNPQAAKVLKPGADAARIKARKLFEELGRNYKGAMDATRQSRVLDLAEADVKRMFRESLPTMRRKGR